MKSTQISLLFLLFTLSFSFQKKTSNASKETIMTNQETKEKFLYLEIYGEKGASAQVRLNDIPACELSASDENSSGNSFSQVKYYVKPGRNTISIYPLSKKGKLTIRLVNYTKGGFTGRDKGEELINVIIENNFNPIHKQIELAMDRKKWSWMDTDIITDNKSKEEAIDFAKNFYKIMKQNNIKEMISVADPIITYDLISKPNITKEELIKRWEKGMKMAFNDKNIFDDINTISIQLNTIANGRLFEVKRKDGSDFFRTSDKSNFVVGFNNIIGRKNGVWKFYH